MTSKHVITFFYLYLCASLGLMAQQQMGRGVQDRSAYYQYGEPFYCEPIITAHTNQDSARVTFLFKIMNDVVAFSKNQKIRDPRGSYVAAPFVTIEIRNSENIIIRRLGWKDSAFVSNFDKTNAKNEFIYGVGSLILSTGKYTADIVLGDKETPQIRKIKTQPIIIGKPSQHWMSNIVFGKNFEDTVVSKIIPVHLGGDMPFGTDKVAAIVTLFGQKDYTQFSWKIEQLRSQESNASWGSFATIESFVTSNPKKVLHFTEEALFGSGIDTYMTLINVDKNAASLIIPMPTESLVPGRYKLTIVSSSDTKDSITHTFDVRWDKMPMSLIRPTYAIECMYYILSDEEYDEMNSGNDEEKRKKLFNYWKTKDPTPGTMFNEAMAEYFRRVDYAFFNFQTLAENDGAKSQRGKIYILFGAPKHVEKRLTDDNRVQETWSYPEKVKKEFTFEKSSTGSFKLTKTNDL